MGASRRGAHVFLRYSMSVGRSAKPTRCCSRSTSRSASFSTCSCSCGVTTWRSVKEGGRGPGIIGMTTSCPVHRWVARHTHAGLGRCQEGHERLGSRQAHMTHQYATAVRR